MPDAGARRRMPEPSAGFPGPVAGHQSGSPTESTQLRRPRLDNSTVNPIWRKVTERYLWMVWLAGSLRSRREARASVERPAVAGVQGLASRASGRANRIAVQRPRNFDLSAAITDREPSLAENDDVLLDVLAARGR